MPVMEVRLAPPRHPLPEVAALLGESGNKMTDFHAKELLKVEDALNASLAEASKTLPALVDRLMHVFASPSAWIASSRHLQPQASSFREARGSHGHEMTTRINVLPAASADASVAPMIEALEHKRLSEENARFGQAVEEMKMLTKIVAMEAEAEITSEVNRLAAAQGHTTNAKSLGHAASFLEQPVQSSGPQLTANVRVGASAEPFPTISSMVEGLERKRDAIEESSRKRIEELQLQLLHAENAILEETLQGWVQHILQSHV